MFLNIFQFLTQLPIKIESNVFFRPKKSSMIEYVLNFATIFLLMDGIQQSIKNYNASHKLLSTMTSNSLLKLLCVLNH
jgi:hypothetical protein